MEAEIHLRGAAHCDVGYPALLQYGFDFQRGVLCFLGPFIDGSAVWHWAYDGVKGI
jgi:hypothetical protein